MARKKWSLGRECLRWGHRQALWRKWSRKGRSEGCESSHIKWPGSEAEKGTLAGAECGRETGEQGQLRARARPQQCGGSHCDCDWEPRDALGVTSWKAFQGCGRTDSGGQKASKQAGWEGAEWSGRWWKPPQGSQWGGLSSQHGAHCESRHWDLRTSWNQGMGKTSQGWSNFQPEKQDSCCW